MQVIATEVSPTADSTPASPKRWKSGVVLALILACFLFIVFCFPLRTTVEIGADEGFELGKATLWLHGSSLYSQIWNDQPPLHTFLLKNVLQHISHTIIAARLLTVGFACLLLASLFGIVLRINGLLAAIVATGLLIASPGFLTLSCSCMLEIPAMAVTVAALWLLVNGYEQGWRVPEIAAGVLFAVAMEIKLIAAVLLPLAAVIIWLSVRGNASPWRRFITAVSILILTALAATVITDLLCSGGLYLAHLEQSWKSHFTSATSLEYGSPGDYRFSWVVLLRNWDASIPALFGIAMAIGGWRSNRLLVVPVAWLLLNVLVFGWHRPWWHYYWIHTAIPLCWCGAVGIRGAAVYCASKRQRVVWAVFLVFAASALSLMAGRVYLQIKTTRASPQTFSSLVFIQINRYKPYTKWFYASDPIYSFYADIPMPPDLAVVSLKRAWSGEISDAKISADMSEIQPGMVLLRRSFRPMPFQELIKTQYRLVYEDRDLLLYVHQSIARLPKR